MKKLIFTHSLHNKIMLRSAIFVVLLTLLIGYYTILQASRIEYQTAIKNNRILTQIMSDRFNESSKAFIHQIDFITLDGEMQDLLVALEVSSGESYGTQRRLRSLITLRSIMMDAISGVYLYDTSGVLIVKWEKTPNRDNYRLPDSMELAHYRGDGRVSAAFMDGHLVYNRAIRTLEDQQIVGYISFLYDEDYLKQELGVIAGGDSRMVGLYDSSEHILICDEHHDCEVFLTALSEIDPSVLGNGTLISVDGVGEMLVSGTEAINSGWYLLSAVYSDSFYEIQPLFLLMTLAFALIAILIIVVISLLNRIIVTEPIGKLTAAVRKVQSEEYDINLSIKTGDELEVLSDNFNLMARHIDTLVNKNLKAELAYKEMRFALLQHQIKPHFLYNTLECINALSQLGRTNDVRTITSALAYLMKTKISAASFTTVKEEMNCAEAFLRIYQLMQEGRLAYDIYMEPACSELQIPALIIQPLVENAVLHGIMPTLRRGVCTVKAFCEDGYLHLLVSDDGSGFSPEALKAVEAYLDNRATEEQAAMLGVGIKNIADRVRLLYGAEGHIILLSDKEWGTSFEFVLPYQCKAILNKETI